MTESTPAGSQAFELKQKVSELQTALLDRHPQMPTLLQTIHKTLRSYPECVTLLDEEEIATIIAGLKVQTGVEFAMGALKGAASKTSAARIKNLSLDDF